MRFFAFNLVFLVIWKGDNSLQKPCWVLVVWGFNRWPGFIEAQTGSEERWETVFSLEREKFSFWTHHIFHFFFWRGVHLFSIYVVISLAYWTNMFLTWPQVHDCCAYKFPIQSRWLVQKLLKIANHFEMWHCPRLLLKLLQVFWTLWQIWLMFLPQALHGMV